MKIIKTADKHDEFDPFNIPIKESDIVFIDDLPFLYDGLSTDHKELIFKRYHALDKMEVKFGETITSYSIRVTINNLRDNGTRIENSNGEKIEFPDATNTCRLIVEHDSKRYKEICDASSMIKGREYLLVGRPDFYFLNGDFIAEVIFLGTVCTNPNNPNYMTVISEFNIISGDRILGQFRMALPKNKTSIPVGVRIFEKI